MQPAAVIIKEGGMRLQLPGSSWCRAACSHAGSEGVNLISLKILYMTACEMEVIADPEIIPGSGLSSPLQVPGTD